MDSESEKELSRRSLLKKIGTGAAIAWAAPVLSSFGARAYASTKGCITCDGGPGVGCSVGGDDCFGQVDCSRNSPASFETPYKHLGQGRSVSVYGVREDPSNT